MPKPCPECSTGLLPADDIDCQKANFVCPECAPNFVIANATNFRDVEDPLV
jgi:transposase-like protein